MEFHRRACRLSVVRHRRLLRPRRLRVGDPAGPGRAGARGWGCAGLVALLFAAFIGGAILHLRGHYFAIASLVVAEMLREIVNTTPDLTGGGMGLNLPIMRISVGAQAQFFFYAMLALAVLCTATAILVQHSKLGFGLRCIQQNEDAANILGVNAYAYKTAAFSLSAVFVGIAGAIYASWVNYIEPPDVFDVLLSVKPLVMVLLGGLGTIFGPVIGALILIAFEELVWRNFLTIHAAALGLHHRRAGAVPAQRHAAAAARTLRAAGGRQHDRAARARQRVAPLRRPQRRRGRRAFRSSRARSSA